MKVSDEIQQMLDDHLVLTQQISFSPFKGAFSERIDEWEEKLRVTSEVIEEWMDVQKYNKCVLLLFLSLNVTFPGSGCTSNQYSLAKISIDNYQLKAKNTIRWRELGEEL